jgi:hypothetical protein
MDSNSQDGDSASDYVFLGITVSSFLLGIASSFILPLISTRPLLFGIFLGCLVHKWMGGVDKGEITDFKSAIGNAKLQGPAAAIIICTTMLTAIYSVTPDPEIAIKKPRDGEEVVILDPDTGLPSEIEAQAVGKAHGAKGRVPSDKDYDGIFSLFMDACIPKSVDGCRIKVKVVSAGDVPVGQARMCNQSRTPIEIPIFVNTIHADANGGEAVPLVLSNYKKQCSTRNTIFISRKDEKTYRLNLIDEKAGYYMPNIGVAQSRP